MVPARDALPDYKDNAAAYEIEERSRPDEMLMIDTVSSTVTQILDRRGSSSILDLCCGTGLPLLEIVGHPHARQVCGVDISEEYLRFARERFSNSHNVSFLLGDAVTCDLPATSYDIITMSSAYHHIEDERKLQFLRRVCSLLGRDGIAVVGENILPPYETGDKQSYSEAVRLFYEEVLATAEADGHLPPEVKGLIQRVAQYGFDGDYEYKTHVDEFLAYVQEAKLRVRDVRKVWPVSGRMCTSTGGNYVFLLEQAL